MADIIDEINEEIKQERMQALFAKYGKIVIGFAGAVVAVVIAVQGYGLYQDSTRKQAATAYFNALGEDDIGGSLAAVEVELAGGYAMLSRFVTAAELVSKDDNQAAYDIYRALADDASVDQIYRHFAAMLAVTNAPESIDTEALMELIAPIAQSSGPTQGLALELMANLALRAGDLAGAKAHLSQIEELQDAPNGLRQRAATLAVVLDSQN